MQHAGRDCVRSSSGEEGGLGKWVCFLPGCLSHVLFGRGGRTGEAFEKIAHGMVECGILHSHGCHIIGIRPINPG